MHNRASVKGILSLAEGFKRVAAKTGTITRPSTFISLQLHCVIWLHGLLNRAKPIFWRHHRPEMVEFVDRGMMFEEGHYPVLQIVKHTEIDGMQNIGYDNSHRRDVFHIPEDTS
jgi:hypothetical protein